MTRIGKKRVLLFITSLVIFCLLSPANGKTENRHPLTKKFLKNTEYRILLGDGVVKLQEGQFKSGSSPEDYLDVRLIKVALGDLNGDGLKDAGVILTISGGGSGTFYELTAMISQGNSFSQAESILLGDRVMIHSFNIESQGIVLDMVVHRESDPSCCPTQRVLRRYRLENSKFKAYE